MNHMIPSRLPAIDGETLMSKPLQPLNFVVDTLISQGLHIQNRLFDVTEDAPSNHVKVDRLAETGAVYCRCRARLPDRRIKMNICKCQNSTQMNAR